MTDTPRTYPEKLEMVPFRAPPWGELRPPGSKSMTNRELVLAALSGGGWIERPLRSEDSEVMVAALQQLGFDVKWACGDISIRSNGTDRIIPAERADLLVGNSGTTMRFLTAMVSLGRGRYRLDGVPRMRERPIGDLLDALRQLGVNAVSEAGNGRPPVVIEADGWRGGKCRLRGDISSQFLSALLLAAPFAEADTEIALDGPLVSGPYVALTLAMLRRWGRTVEELPGPVYRIPGGQPRTDDDGGDIETDASAASYFCAAAAITGGKVFVYGLSPDSLQGDVRFVDVLRQMGCEAMYEGASPYTTEGGTLVSGGPLRGIDVDMNAISDTVMTLAAVACFAEGPTTIRNVAHIRHKETDRLAALATELRKLGAAVEEFADGLTITQGPLHGAEIETYNDHRMAMSLALIGLRVPGVVIKNPGCVAKTYPGFFEDLEKLRR
jgi:3-phosphoshikimate 1-carboxyvinyltransferase